MGELAPDCRADLRDLLGRAEPVEPRHQRGVQACGDRQGRRRNRSSGAPGFALALRLQHRLRHLLDEQRNAVGALYDFRRYISPAAPCSRPVGRSWPPLSRSPSRLSAQSCHMRPSDPRRREFRPERYDQQHPKVANPVHRPAERFQARGVGPMGILEDHQHRLSSWPMPPVVQSSASSVLLPALLRG